MDLKALRDERGKLTTDARAILDQAESEKRALSSEEEATYDKLMNEQDKILNTIQRHERQMEAERDAAKQSLNSQSNGSGMNKPSSSEMERYKAFLLGNIPMSALQSDSNPGGGFLLPQEVTQDLLKRADDALFIRQLATKLTVGASDSLGIPTLETDPDDFDWTSEMATGREDNSMGFGKRELRPHPLAKSIRVSKTLLRRLPGIVSIINERLAYKLAVTQEKAFLLGDGHQKPLGLFTPSKDGIPTDRDIQTAFTADGLNDVFYSTKVQYQRTGSWLFNREGVKRLAKLKDSTGQYLWQPSIKDGDPDRLKNRPVMQSEFVPGDFTNGQYVGLFGDFSKYFIAEALTLQIDRLQEFHAYSNQDGFILRYEGDGAPVLPEAFSRIKLT